MKRARGKQQRKSFWKKNREKEKEENQEMQQILRAKEAENRGRE